MKNKKTIFLLILLIIILFLTVNGKKKNLNKDINITVDLNNVINNVPKNMFGFNYWMWVPSWNNMVFDTEELIKPLNIKLLRFGGINNDVDYPDPVDEDAINNFLDYCQAIGAEPVVQLPVARYKNNEERLERAYKMIEIIMKKTKLKYVSIGNEPDIYDQVLANDSNYKVYYLKGYSVDQYIKDFNIIANALKAKYKDLKIIGLDLSHKEEWISKFVKNCKDNLDYLSVHYYPFSASQSTYNNVKNNYKEIEEFYGRIIKTLKDNADGKSIPLIIGETNSCWEGDPKLANKDASMGTFNAGLWIADMIGITTAQKEVYSIMPWSIREGWNNGFLDANKDPRPVYYIYKMFSSFNLSQLILFKKVNDNLRIYGYKNNKNEPVIYIVNWDNKNPQVIHFNFNESLKNLKFDYECIPSSLTCIKISNDGKIKTAYVYSEKDKNNGIKESVF